MLLLLLGLPARRNVTVSTVGGFHGGELGDVAGGFLRVLGGGAMAVVLRRPQLLQGERRMVRRLAAEQRPPLPVVRPHLQDGLFERTRGERVKDGVQGAVDGQNEYDHPGADGTCGQEGRVFFFFFFAKLNFF